MADYTVSAKITGDASGFQKAFESAQKVAERAGQTIQNAGAKLTAATAAFAGVAAIGVKYNATMETYQTSFEVMTGSAEKAADTVDRLKNIAASTPFEMPNLADTTQLLMNYGFTADEALDRMQMLGDIAQGSADKMNRIAAAYGQMSSAGKVSLEDVKQMIEAGFNPLQEISETTGESMDSLYQRISDGAISVDEITASMQRSTSEGGKYFQSMEKQSQTFSGQLSTLKDNAQGLLGNLTEGVFEKLAQDILPKINEVVSLINDAFESEGLNGVMSVLQSMVPQLEPVLNFIDTLREKLNGLGIDPMMFAGAVAAAGPMLIVLGKVVSIGGSVMGTVSKLGSVFSALASPVGIVVAAIAAAAAAFAYLMSTNEEFRTSIMETVSNLGKTLGPVLETIGGTLMELGATLLTAIGETLQTLAPTIAQIVSMVGELLNAIAPVIAQLVTSLVPVLEQLITMGLQIIEMVLPVVADILAQLMPVIIQIVELVGNLVAELAPLISQLISALMPVIMEIISTVMEIVSSLMPPLIAIIEAVMAVIEALMPPIMQVLEVVIQVISSVMEVITPIIGFIAGITAKIMEIITPIIQFIADVIGQIMSIVGPIYEFFAGVFASVFDVVSEIMGNVGKFIGGIFEGVENAWNGLTGFVSSVIDGIASAFDTLVGTIKSIFNIVIGAINGAIWTINLIPGVHIDEMPYLLHGTDDWQGGFARMNEGGRGELTYLPNGTQVIPHDISVKYAKEAARANVQQAESAVFMIDYDRLAAAMTKVHLTPVVALDGERVSRSLSPYTDVEMGNRARQTARGMI